MALWASTKGFSTKVNWLMVCVEVGKAGLRTAQQFGKQFSLPSCSSTLINGYIAEKNELPKYGQLGCQGFIVLGPHGEFAMQRTVPCYLEKGKTAFRSVEKLLASLWNIQKDVAAVDPAVSRPQAITPQASLTTGVTELDVEHTALDELARELQATESVEVLKKLLALWRQHSEHEEELFEKFDFGRHRTAGKEGGLAGTASHCEHHRLIASKMEAAVQESYVGFVASESIAFLLTEMKRHVDIYDAAYAGKLTGETGNGHCGSCAARGVVAATA
eukprot:TRINITY_DN40045_c0_g1_i2.p1 TRINITY_DN40045_c0_g1~~TRINITY_DN40045_c0_g1_i2.p1  ORF type:complete len:275 (+),score=60.48 TRINITY_DN40045_c0_g1_i2:273-1097(+)